MDSRRALMRREWDVGDTIIQYLLVVLASVCSKVVGFFPTLEFNEVPLVKRFP